MPAVALNKGSKNGISVAKNMRDYRDEPVFKKKAEKVTKFLKKHGLPKSLGKKKK